MGTRYLADPLPSPGFLLLYSDRTIIAMESHPHTETVETRIGEKEVVVNVDVSVPDGVE